jgi:hypothetical protein
LLVQSDQDAYSDDPFWADSEHRRERIKYYIRYIGEGAADKDHDTELWAALKLVVSELDELHRIVGLLVERGTD